MDVQKRSPAVPVDLPAQITFNKDPLFITYLSFAIIVVVNIAYLLIKITNIIPEYDLGVVANILSIVGAFIFLIASAWALYSSMNLKIRNSLIFFVISSFFYLLAETTWAIYTFIFHVDIPYPSIADVFYVIASVSMIGAIYLVTKTVRKNARINIVFISLMVLGSALIAIIFFAISKTNPLGLYANGVINWEIVLDLLYPTLDVIALVILGRLLEVSLGRSVFDAMLILALATCLMSFADVYFSISTAMNVYADGDISDYLYILVYVLYGIGVWRYAFLTRKDILKTMETITKIKYLEVTDGKT